MPGPPSKNVEAKGKAPDAKAQAKAKQGSTAKIANAKITKSAVVNNSILRTALIFNELPGGNPLLKAQDEAKLEELQAFFGKYPTDAIKHKGDNVALQISLSSDVRLQTVNEVKELQKWLQTRKKT